MEAIVKNVLAGVATVFTYLFGGWSILILALLILNVLDFILGILASDEPVNSKRLTEGGTKKGIMWMWVLIANILYLVIEHMGYSIGVSIANWVLLYYILTELVSLEENSAKLGSPIPQPISWAIGRLKEFINEKFKTQHTK